MGEPRDRTAWHLQRIAEAGAALARLKLRNHLAEQVEHRMADAAEFIELTLEEYTEHARHEAATSPAPGAAPSPPDGATRGRGADQGAEGGPEAHRPPPGGVGSPVVDSLSILDPPEGLLFP